MAKRAKKAEAKEVEPEVAEEVAEEAPTEIKIILTAAPAEPMPLYVHGVGKFSIRLGEEVTLPIAALDALDNAAGVQYEKVK